MRRSLAAVLVMALAGAAPSQDDAARTAAERSDYARTTRHGEVLAILRTLDKECDTLRLITMGRSPGGLEIPLVVLADPLPARPLPRTGRQRPVLYIQANIHAGEVAGKEAALILLRRVVREGWLRAELADLVLLVAPIFNCDGNEKISPRNRYWQKGPREGVGERYNGQGLDLNRDATKLETPELRALLERVLLPWDPDLLVDCHTTNGSSHRHPLLIETPTLESMDPGLRAYGRERLLPALLARVAKESGMEFVQYGHFRSRSDPAKGWVTFPALPRYLTNYMGARGRLALLSEAYVYRDFRTRVKATLALLAATIRETAARRRSLLELAVAVDRRTRGGAAAGVRLGLGPVNRRRARPITVWGQPDEVVRDPKSGRRHINKIGEPRRWTIPFFGVARSDRTAPLPWGWLLPPGAESQVALLRRHGITVRPWVGVGARDVEYFRIAAIKRRTRPYQGHRLLSLAGSRRRATLTLPPGSHYVPGDTPLAWLAAWLLDPQSPDGLTAWGAFDKGLRPGGWHPVLALPAQ